MWQQSPVSLSQPFPDRLQQPSFWQCRISRLRESAGGRLGTSRTACPYEAKPFCMAGRVSDRSRIADSHECGECGADDPEKRNGYRSGSDPIATANLSFSWQLGRLRDTAPLCASRLTSGVSTSKNGPERCSSLTPDNILLSEPKTAAVSHTNGGTLADEKYAQFR